MSTTGGTLNSNPCFRSNNYATATATTTTTTSSIFYSILLLLRGPIIVIGVIISLLFPYIQEYCTVWVFMHITIANIGLLWIYHDLKIIIESNIRTILNFILNKIILDDILKAIYDPIDGIWACFVGTFVGASTMYGLNMNNEQKIELIQSSFSLHDRNEAHTVLLEPGGCKELLPVEVQKWLSAAQNNEEIQINNNNNNNNNATTSTSTEAYTINNGPPYSPLSPSSYTSDCDIADIDDCDDDDDDECRNYLDIFEEEDDNDDLIKSAARERQQQQQRTDTAATSTSSSRSKSNNSTSCSSSSSNQQTDNNNNHNKNDPVTVFCKILQKMIIKKLTPCAESLQQSQTTIENVGITSAMIAIGIQYIAFRQRRRHQQRHQQQRSMFPFP
ncbi:MAG: hypothetical protein ACI8RD_014366, partial [Bacillariaceae sp.]